MIRNFSRGFTLIELLIVMAIVAILATIAYPTFIGVQERAKVTKDMNNLRQIGIATQLYMNDNDGAIFSTGVGAASWMKQLHPKYLSSWNVFQSPFDNPVPPRTASEDDTNSAVSYGINNGPSNNVVGASADKISKPSIFILFAPAQALGTAVSFQGTAGFATLPGVTVLGIGGNQATSTPGGNATGGTHGSRTKINALFADLHLENMTWTTFTSNTANPPTDPDGNYRWNP
jgi:prepilin-type N-terminal cleavage/methylation domain-containing protein